MAHSYLLVLPLGRLKLNPDESILNSVVVLLKVQT